MLACLGQETAVQECIFTDSMAIDHENFFSNYLFIYTYFSFLNMMSY